MSRKIFLISDPHFGHYNVLRFGNRPFSTTEEMEEALVARWNEKVGKRDVVICLGDWSMKASQYKVLERLNGMKRLVMGNHDTGDPKILAEYFHSIHGSLKLKGLFLTHIPVLQDGYHNYDWVVHGHIHDKAQNVSDHRYININMDAWPYVAGDEYAPIPLEDILEEAERRKVSFEKGEL